MALLFYFRGSSLHDHLSVNSFTYFFNISVHIKSLEYLRLTVLSPMYPLQQYIPLRGSTFSISTWQLSVCKHHF